MNRINQPIKNRSFFKIFYLVSMLFLAITGFGQMPIYKRYYISAIPGLGWTADFYTTLVVHYVFAAILLGIIFYAGADFFFNRRKSVKLNPSGIGRGIILVGIAITGISLVIFNLSSVSFSQGFVIFLDLSHLGLVMVFLLTGFLCIILKYKWVTPSR